jgi:hypothetical protein
VRQTAWSRGRTRVTRLWQSSLPALIAGLVALGGAVVLVAAMLGFGPRYLGAVGSVAVATAYCWALAARVGGRPMVFGAVALAIGVAVAWLDRDFLTTGAAVMTGVVSAVLAVMATVPAVSALRVLREVMVATVVAAVGALAVVGFEPAVSLVRFEYTTLVLSLVVALGLVHRLGAGLHGLGRRGILTVAVGGVVLAVTLAYGELLRRYGTPELVERLLEMVRWSRANLGAFPRPLEAVLGVPALTWGIHMRARRGQGWWVCSFGVAATAPIATSLVNTSVSVVESSLAVVYGMVVGLLIGFLLIRVDLLLSGTGRRRGSRAQAEARPEPSRTRPLL